ncbi:hypothetical protein [Kouleothrix sp.]|uniref:hypothetical protein n=1 Tax=Kouleothrix sp. TaxID=2779161 RepID=UPI003919500E
MRWLAQLLSIPLGQDAELRLRLAGERTVATSPMVLRRVLLHCAQRARGQAPARRHDHRAYPVSAAAAVEIRLERSGPGVPADVRLALDFQRQITTKNRPGGLGLMFVRIMLEGLGCRIKLLPSAAGAVFAIELPSAL